MNYLQRKKLAFMSIVNQVKGFLRTISGVPPITLESCVDDKSVINYQIYGNSAQDGEPTPDNPVEVVSVGEKTVNLFDYKDFIESGKSKEIDSGIQFEITGSRIQITKYITLKANTTYFLSAECTEDGYIGGGLIIDSNGNKNYRWCSKSTKKIVVRNETNIDREVDFSLVDLNGTKGSTIKFAMFKIGNTATEYEPYGYKIPITASGKNLFDISKTTGFTSQYGGLTNTIDGNVLTVKSSVASRGGTLTLGTFKPGTYYIGIKTLSHNDSTLSVFKQEGFTRLGNANTVITITEEMVIQIYTAFYSDIISQFTDIQIVEANKVSDYEPYHEPITTNIYLNEPLRAIGDYKDYVDFESGKIVRAIKQGQINGNSAINKFTSVTDYSAFFLDGISLVDYTFPYVWNIKVFSNTFKFRGCGTGNTNAQWTDAYQISSAIAPGYKRILFTLPNTITDTTTAKEWLTENPIDYLHASEPIEETIDLSNLPTFKGTTIYTIGTTVQPTNMEVTYYSTVKE